MIEATQPIRGFVLASTVYHFFDQGVFDRLRERGPAPVATLASALRLSEKKLRGLLDFLVNENVLARGEANDYALTSKAHQLARFRGWYTMLIGGYGHTFLQMGPVLGVEAPWASRDAAKVGIGSCQISHYDAMPLTRSLMARAPGRKRNLLDLGCGNALYLAEFCQANPDLYALGVEPDRGGYEAGLETIRRHGLEERVWLVNLGAVEFMRSEIDFDPDFLILGFVLHEIVGSEGKDGTVRFLRSIVERFPQIRLIVIEVDDRWDDPGVMQHGLSLAYYNAYYLLHAFTRQQLLPHAEWLELFATAGLEVLATESTAEQVDSTRLEIGYLLRAAGEHRHE
ncbi:2-ketoarginine methyltransferase [Xanthomonas theicola]|uniref:2-ketoarginine methyltransferase n=1 Tax=Xanthomonas theicola TaxID=56464 RepID=UPI001B80B2EF|nr:2-ketoarginine methyltransferase [Xanthomonas theicola]